LEGWPGVHDAVTATSINTVRSTPVYRLDVLLAMAGGCRDQGLIDRDYTDLELQP
jgi:hypothetical protein